MSKLDDLIKQYCSNGIKYKELGTLEDEGYLKLGRGAIISKEDLRTHQGEYPVYSSSAVGNGALGYYGKYMFDDERISWSIDGGGRFFYRPKHKYSITNVCGWCQVIKTTELSTKYLYYYLTNEWTKKTFDYNKKAHPSVIRKEYIVAIPPLPIQEEIVRILDGFTELGKELEKELEKRKQQYEYYEKQLLTPENMNGNVKLETLEDIAEIKRGIRVVKNDLEPTGEYAVYQNSLKPLGYYDKYNYEGFTTFVITAGAAGDIGFSLSPFWAADDCLGIKTPKSLNNKYVYHFLSTKQDFLYSRVRRGAVPRLSREAVEKLKIPVPSLAEQERIVGILDKFDALISNISAEIDGRKKQYEYYRSKLLTFPQAV